MNDLYNYKKYFFIFAHPDDEVYSCILMKRLLQEKKEVHAIYITTGDAKGMGSIRKKELFQSMKAIGLKKNDLHLLNISENAVSGNINKIILSLRKLAKKYKPDCIIGHDFEGGHEVHDIASYCASKIVSKTITPNFYVFPVYHGKPEKRQATRFKPGIKTNIIKIALTRKEMDLKKKILKIHKSQKSHFDGLKKSSKNYLELLLGREIFRKIKKDINYKKRPMKLVGYEYHRNGFKFEDFKKSLIDS